MSETLFTDYRNRCAELEERGRSTQLGHLLNVGIRAERVEATAGALLVQARLQNHLILSQTLAEKLALAEHTIASLLSHAKGLERDVEEKSCELLHFKAHANAMDMAFSDLSEGRERYKKRTNLLLSTAVGYVGRMGLTVEDLGLKDSGCFGEDWVERLRVLDISNGGGRFNGPTSREAVDEVTPMDSLNRFNEYAGNTDGKETEYADQFFRRSPHN